MEPVTFQTIDALLLDGLSDPPYYHRRPVVSALLWEGSDLAIDLLPARQFDRALEFTCGSGSPAKVLNRSAEPIERCARFSDRR